VNERIKQLAEQAGDYVNEVYIPPVRSKTPGKIWEDGHIDWYTQFNEKFAELIVRECARIGELKEQGYEDYDPDLSVGWYMKQHFGVES
jgi:hypothetical protein